MCGPRPTLFCPDIKRSEPNSAEVLTFFVRQAQICMQTPQKKYKYTGQNCSVNRMSLLMTPRARSGSSSSPPSSASVRSLTGASPRSSRRAESPQSHKFRMLLSLELLRRRGPARTRGTCPKYRSTMSARGILLVKWAYRGSA